MIHESRLTALSNKEYDARGRTHQWATYFCRSSCSFAAVAATGSLVQWFEWEAQMMVHWAQSPVVVLLNVFLTLRAIAVRLLLLQPRRQVKLFGSLQKHLRSTYQLQ